MLVQSISVAFKRCDRSVHVGNGNCIRVGHYTEVRNWYSHLSVNFLLIERSFRESHGICDF